MYTQLENNLEKYKRLGVKEVWFWLDCKLDIYISIDSIDRQKNYSFNLPKLEDKLLTKYISQVLNNIPRKLENKFFK